MRNYAPTHNNRARTGLPNPSFETTFGGGDANVAVALCNYGLNSGVFSGLPDNDLGDAAIRELRSFGADTSMILRSGDRVGNYYLEAGTNQRLFKVVYDRARSSICEAGPGDFDWPAILEMGGDGSGRVQR